DIVIASTIQRLVEREGACVRSADGTGDGDAPDHELTKNIVDVFAQHERAIIRARTPAALAVKRARGERVGRVPCGFQLVLPITRRRQPAESTRARQLRLRRRSAVPCAPGASHARPSPGVQHRRSRSHVPQSCSTIQVVVWITRCTVRAPTTMPAINRGNASPPWAANDIARMSTRRPQTT
ncbi:MAG: recombinase family protein, partial [Microbacteriaceae bacterium]|nr:recombinase family protein [Microbacteriaceae bacterium]